MSVYGAKRYIKFVRKTNDNKTLLVVYIYPYKDKSVRVEVYE